MPSSQEPFLTFTGAAPVDGNRPRLYCFPYAGGASSAFAPWARMLAPQISVLGVELPGHGSRFSETPFDSVSEMAEDAADAIASSESDAPFALYGHSLGAVVAFETAQILQRMAKGKHARPPIHLFVGAARAPHLPTVLTPISHLPQKDFLDAVQRRYGGLPAALFDEPELLEMVLPVLRADFKAYEDYRYADSSILECPVTGFHGSLDPVVRNAAMSEWSRVTDGSFRLYIVDGDHFFLNTCKEVLLAAVRDGFEQQAQNGSLDFSSQYSTGNPKY